MKLLIKPLLIFLFFISGTLFAQTASPSAVLIMNKTAQKYNAFSAFSLDFKMDIAADGKKMYNIDGVLLVKKEKYHLTMEDQVVANDGKMMWNYQKSANEVSLFEAEDDEFMMFHPLTMLQDWDKQYSAKFICEEEFQKKRANILDLKPKISSPFNKIRLYIDKSTSHILQVIMYDPDEVTFTYTVMKFTPNAVAEDNKFTFNKKEYKDVHVNDMR